MTGEVSGWLSSLRALLERLDQSDVVELEISTGEATLYVRRAAGDAQRTAHPQHGEGVPAPSTGTVHERGTAQDAGSTAAAGPAAVDEDAGLVAVISPLAGVYYAAPMPHAPPFVDEGDFVERDQIVALVEAMKVFNEIRSEQAGRVVRIVARSGQLVRAGDTILLLAAEEAAAPGARALV